MPSESVSLAPGPVGITVTGGALHVGRQIVRSLGSNMRSIDCGMAGGMNRRDTDRIPLYQRIRDTPTPTPQPTQSRQAPSVRHCWVTDEQGPLPGLLLEWRRTATGWQGRVVRPAPEAGVWIVWIVVEEWLPAELLEQG
jgi:hypothetical protein